MKCTIEGEHTSTVLLVWHYVYVEVIAFLNPAQTFLIQKIHNDILSVGLKSVL